MRSLAHITCSPRAPTSMMSCRWIGTESFRCLQRQPLPLLNSSISDSLTTPTIPANSAQSATSAQPTFLAHTVRTPISGGESTTIADSATAAATAAAERGGSVAGPAARAAPGGRIKTILRVRPVGAEAGPLSLTVNHGSRTTVTTLRPATETRGPLSESFVCDRVMDASAVQVSVRGTGG